MKKVLVLMTMLVYSMASLAAEEAQVQQQTRQTIYGSQLMTPQERMEYRTRMRSLKTRQEREAFRLQHHKEMQERARERGMQLPDMPPPGGGMGSGMGGGY